MSGDSRSKFGIWNGIWTYTSNTSTHGRSHSAVPSPRVDTPADGEDVDFGFHFTACDDNNDNIENEDEIYNKEEGDVGFGSPDIYDVQELIEMCLEDPGIDVEHEAHDKVKQLKKDYIGKNSNISYHYSLVNFCFTHTNIRNI